jgi:large subunit ribosomal protein L21
MYAIVECLGQQVTVRPGDKVTVPHMEGKPGTKVTLDRVLLLGGENTAVGTPHVEGASVSGTISEQTRDDKVLVFKLKRRTKYRVLNGHRQPWTILQIDSIDAP